MLGGCAGFSLGVVYDACLEGPGFRAAGIGFRVLGFGFKV